MKKFYIFPYIIFLMEIIFPIDTEAIPAFARKYGFNCNMCHTGFTKLNDWGQRFRDDGYQIPGQEGTEKNVFDTPPPISMRTSFGYTAYKNNEGTSSTFNLYGLDLLAAGVLHKNISFLLVYTPRIDEPSNSFQGPNNLNSNPSQLGVLESVSLVFSNIIQDALNIRVGRFEPAYHVFSSKRSYYLFEPYEIYTLTTPNNSYSFNDNQIGIELTGHFRSGFKYAAGIVNGNGASPDNNNQKDLYANIVQTFGNGDGQSAGQRLGVFGYYGWQPMVLPGTVVGTMGETNGSDNKTFYRIGTNGSFNWDAFNLQALYMIGIDDKAFNTMKPTEDYQYTGGFVELDYAGLFNDKLVASIMFNWITPPSYNNDREINAYSALLRYYLGDWSAVNIALHFEYTHRETGNNNKIKEDLVALALDFAF
ncbi:MAG: hypothetical protein ACYC6P_08035 [Ignavibacteriaceae bacterium]